MFLEPIGTWMLFFKYHSEFCLSEILLQNLPPPNHNNHDPQDIQGDSTGRNFPLVLCSYLNLCGLEFIFTPSFLFVLPHIPYFIVY